MYLRSPGRPRRQRPNPWRPTRRLPPLPQPVRSMTAKLARSTPSARVASAKGKGATPPRASVRPRIGCARRTSKSTAGATGSRSPRAAVARVGGSRTAARAKRNRSSFRRVRSVRLAPVRTVAYHLLATRAGTIAGCARRPAQRADARAKAVNAFVRSYAVVATRVGGTDGMGLANVPLGETRSSAPGGLRLLSAAPEEHRERKGKGSYEAHERHGLFGGPLGGQLGSQRERATDLCGLATLRNGGNAT